MTVLWDDRVSEIYGKPANEPRSIDDWAATIHPDDLDRARKEFNEGIATGRYSSEYRLLLPDGEIRNVRSRAICFQDGTDTPKMIGAEWDVTADVALNRELERAKTLAETRNAELEAAKGRIEHNALHDSLTGLPNRRYLDEILEHYAGAERAGGIALLHIDLDRFKQINDTLGHAAGDAMLVHASNVLKSTVRPEDFVARIGGDEFVVVCRGDAKTDQLEMLADRIIGRMREPVSYHGHQCRFGVSIGIAIDEGDSLDARRLLVNADIALYRAKSRGRNRHEFFTDTLQAEIVRTKRIADEILGGLERSEFVAHYQLQFDAKTLEIAGVEALARWNHPKDGHADARRVPEDRGGSGCRFGNRPADPGAGAAQFRRMDQIGPSGAACLGQCLGEALAGRRLDQQPELAGHPAGDRFVRARRVDLPRRAGRCS